MTATSMRFVLAVSGLERGGHGARVTEALDVATMLPAAGQGALGIECRRGDARVEALVAPLACPRSSACVLAERAFNRRLEGGCQVPIAAYAALEDGGLSLRGLVASLDGARVLRARVRGRVEDAETARRRGRRRGSGAGRGRDPRVHLRGGRPVSGRRRQARDRGEGGRQSKGTCQLHEMPIHTCVRCTKYGVFRPKQRVAQVHCQ